MYFTYSVKLDKTGSRKRVKLGSKSRQGSHGDRGMRLSQTQHGPQRGKKKKGRLRVLGIRIESQVKIPRLCTNHSRKKWTLAKANGRGGSVDIGLEGSQQFLAETGGQNSRAQYQLWRWLENRKKKKIPVSTELRKGQEPNCQGKECSILDQTGGLQSCVVWPINVIWPKPKSDFGTGVKDAPDI